MTYLYGIEQPAGPNTIIRGPYKEGSEAWIAGRLQVVQTGVGVFYPIVETPAPDPHAVAGESWDNGTKTLTRTWIPDPRTTADAHAQKLREAGEHWGESLAGGTAYTGPGGPMDLPTEQTAAVELALVASAAGGGGQSFTIQDMHGAFQSITKAQADNAIRTIAQHRAAGARQLH